MGFELEKARKTSETGEAGWVTAHKSPSPTLGSHRRGAPGPQGWRVTRPLLADL